MEKRSLPLAEPLLNGNEAKYLQECIETGFVSSAGPFVKRFELALASFLEEGSCTLVNSGTAAIHLCLHYLKIGPGDLVLAPSLTFIGTINPIRYTQACPHFIDVDEDDWCLSPNKLQSFLTNKTYRDQNGLLKLKASNQTIRAVIAVYAAGNTPKLKAIYDICQEWRLHFIADGAASVGATYENASIIPWADFTTFSFNGNKTITSGGGGAIASSNLEAIIELAHLSSTARVSANYDHDKIGFNYRLTNLQAAVGLAQLERIDFFLERKKRIFNFYKIMAQDIPGAVCFPTSDNRGFSHWFSGIMLPSLPPDIVIRIIEQLNQFGIGARPFWKPIHYQQPYLEFGREDLTVTERIWSQIITLPCSVGLKDEDLEFIKQKIFKVCTPHP